ncbi:MAG: hypothetical protein GF355_03670 [Candidatus Eisenbacteria bacterium]|nr:hypothetical protein [Candidatus Eisenbacteria bacterium]
MLTATAAEPAERVVEIELERNNVFVAEPDSRLPLLYRLANSLHVTTRPFVIRNELLIEEGEPFDSLRFAESLRLLRNRNLFQAVSGSTAVTDSGVVAHVRTQDYWTLRVQTGYSRGGGDQNALLGVYDSNILGTGNTVTLTQRWSTDRDQTRLAVVLPRLVGRRESLSFQFRQTSDGRVTDLGLGRSPDTPSESWSYGLGAYRVDGEWTHYEEDEEVAEFDFREEYGLLYVGRYTGEETQTGAGFGGLYFDFTPDSLRYLRQPLELIDEPGEEAYRMLFAMAGAKKRRFIKTRYLERIGVVEDFPLGWAAQVIFGRNIHGLGASDRRSHAELILQGSTRWSDHWWAAVDAWGSAEWEDGVAGRQRLRLDSRLMYRHTLKTLTALQLSGRFGRRLPSEERAYLGGRSGLRGYPTRALGGNQYLLLNLENRVWTPLRVLFFELGFSVFGDIAWLSDRRQSFSGARPRPAAGVGLLIGNRKAVSGILRVELARRLDGVSELDLIITMNTLLRLIPEVNIPAPVFDLYNHKL